MLMLDRLDQTLYIHSVICRHSIDKPGLLRAGGAEPKFGIQLRLREFLHTEVLSACGGACGCRPSVLRLSEQ